MKSSYDVVILGAGHNGLVSAGYLARAGLNVLLLEKNDYIGGATTSQKVFPDYDAHLSRYSYLVSLFPEKIIRDLGLNLELRRRYIACFDGTYDEPYDAALDDYERGMKTAEVRALFEYLKEHQTPLVHAVADAEPLPEAPESSERLSGDVEFRKVRFGYEAGRPVLEGIDIRVKEE